MQTSDRIIKLEIVFAVQKKTAFRLDSFESGVTNVINSILMFTPADHTGNNFGLAPAELGGGH